MKILTVLALFALLGNLAIAQKKEIRREIKTEITDSETPGKKKVRIEKKVNGKVNIIELEIDAKDLKDGKEINFIDGFEDSTINGDKKVKVIIKNGNDEHFKFEEELSHQRGNNHVRIYSNRDREFSGGRNGEFEFEMRRLQDRLADIQYKLKTMKPFEWDNPILGNDSKATIKSLDVFTNKPETDILNIRFFAPNEGDVNITVLDIKGNVVAKSEAKKFTGEYVGQLKLKKDSKGAFFVIVAQREDAMSKKIKID